MAAKKKEQKIFPDFVNIQGTPWEITIRKYEEDPYFKKYNADGYCSNPEKLIVICDAATDPEKGKESPRFLTESMKTCLRHEIVHAFLYESGLGESSERFDGPWAIHEEMVDWIAQQAHKIHKAFDETGCLRVMDPDQWIRFQTCIRESESERIQQAHVTA